MTKSLADTIDTAIDFVRAHRDLMTRAEVEELYRIGEDVYVLAFAAGLTDTLPKIPELTPQLESSGLPPVQYESKLNLPGDWDTAPSSDGEESSHREFLVCASPRWFHDMAALRRLAETQHGELDGRTTEADNAAKAVESADSNAVANSMTWQEAAKRLEELRSQGETWTSQHKIAKRFGCSSATINKAIRETPSLKGWAKQQAAAPTAQSLTPPSKDGSGWEDIVTDRTAQSRELEPVDAASIREYLAGDLLPEERAFFNGLSVLDQLEFLAGLEDPNESVRLLRRKA